MSITGFGEVATLAKDVLDRFFPSKSEEEKQQLAVVMSVIQGQLEVNKAEAQNPSVFVSGWRPFIGWCCGLACVWNWCGLPIAKFAAIYIGRKIELSPADLSEMMPILIGMLGLGGLRTYEKVQGVAAK